MPISKKLSLTDEQLEELMTSNWNMRIATVGPGTRINLTPMWFGWSAGKIFTFGRGQKVANVRRNPECTIIVDRNERYPELQAAMFQGTAKVLESAADELAEPGMSAVRTQMGRKYSGGHGSKRKNTLPKKAIINRNKALEKIFRQIEFEPTDEQEKVLYG